MRHRSEFSNQQYISVITGNKSGFRGNTFSRWVPYDCVCTTGFDVHLFRYWHTTAGTVSLLQS